MAWFVHMTARFIRVIQRAYGRKWTFLAFVLAIFFLSVVLLARLDLLPETNAQSIVTDVTTSATTPTVTLETSPLVMGASAAADTNVSEVAVPSRELPTHIRIPAIDLSVTVSNPDTVNVERLDKALLKGAVRYPLSAVLGTAGNVIIFGHSSYLPVVYNQAYKTFNGIQKLKPGEHVIVNSKSTVYVYAVDTVSKKDASSAAIPLMVSGAKLTLSTCDSFGTKSDRFVVTARLVDSYPIGG